MDLEIDQGLEGLRQLFGVISIDVSKKVIYNSVKQALSTKPCKFLNNYCSKMYFLPILEHFRHSIQTRTILFMS